MHLSPDERILWEYGAVKLNVTILTTWGLMLLLALGSHRITRRLVIADRIPRWQSFVEIIVGGIRSSIASVGLEQPDRHLPFLGTFFVFIATANLFTVVPGYEPPTASLSTTGAMAVCVFVAVPLFGITERGLLAYLKSYVKPTVIMLPFHIISEFSRTLALAVRLFGNMMSGSMLLAILLSITPFFFPIFMTVLGLLTGMVQAYIFSVLATVFIAAATRTHEEWD